MFDNVCFILVTVCQTIIYNTNIFSKTFTSIKNVSIVFYTQIRNAITIKVHRIKYTTPRKRVANCTIFQYELTYTASANSSMESSYNMFTKTSQLTEEDHIQSEMYYLSVLEGHLLLFAGRFDADPLCDLERGRGRRVLMFVLVHECP